MIGQNYKAEMWLITIKEISLFISCPHLIFAQLMLFVPFSCISKEICSHSEEVLRLMKNFIGRFDGGEREKGEMSWKVSLCFPARINLHKSTSSCKTSEVSYSRPETDVWEAEENRDEGLSGLQMSFIALIPTKPSTGCN